MAALTSEDRKCLLKLARSVISAQLFKGSDIERPKVIAQAMAENRGCFVTLHKEGMLRGCIGTIEPVRSLVSNVEENALNAAFRDPRFPPLGPDELPAVEIEISVLSVPTIMAYRDAQELKQKLQPGIHGVIISKDWHSATFLPQVWEQLPDTEVFLEHLCQKAGMKKNCWKDKDITVKVYKAEYFSE